MKEISDKKMMKMIKKGTTCYIIDDYGFISIDKEAITLRYAFDNFKTEKDFINWLEAIGEISDRIKIPISIEFKTHNNDGDNIKFYTKDEFIFEFLDIKDDDNEIKSRLEIISTYFYNSLKLETKIFINNFK